MALSDWDDNRPSASEYNDFYEAYISLANTSNIIQLLIQQGQQVYAFIQKLSAEQAEYQYAKNKWSVKEVIGHLVDTERVMAYRALCIARGEQTSLPGFDQDEYVTHAHFSERILQSLSTEYDAQRNANISLFSSLNEQQIEQTGTANGTTVSVRALAYIIAGHERHHLNLLQDKYDIEITPV